MRRAEASLPGVLSWAAAVAAGCMQRVESDDSRACRIREAQEKYAGLKGVDIFIPAGDCHAKAGSAVATRRGRAPVLIFVTGRGRAAAARVRSGLLIADRDPGGPMTALTR